MITEEQRRALFALREALRLCEDARICIDGQDIYIFHVVSGWETPCGGSLCSTDVAHLLAEHPE